MLRDSRLGGGARRCRAIGCRYLDEMLLLALTICIGMIGYGLHKRAAASGSVLLLLCDTQPKTNT